MIKTYEVHDSSSEDDDEMVEFDPEVVENLNWWQRCFVPKYPVNSCHSGEDGLSESHIPIAMQQKGNKEDQVEEPRGRFNSEDVTVSTRGRFNSEDVTISTNLTTPPGTPDVKQAVSMSSPVHNVSNSCRNNNISYNSSNSNDLETPSLRNAFSAIDEESEVVDKSSEDDKENGQVMDTARATSI
jgi:hypothetical protein